MSREELFVILHIILGLYVEDTIRTIRLVNVVDVSEGFICPFERILDARDRESFENTAQVNYTIELFLLFE